MSISLYNHIALDWVRELGLRDIVETEFGNELKTGTQLSSLVPRIAHQVDTLLRRNGQASVNRVSDDGYHGEQQNYDDNYTDERVLYVAGSGQARGNSWRPGRGPGRWPRPPYSRDTRGRGNTGRGGGNTARHVWLPLE